MKKIVHSLAVSTTAKFRNQGHIAPSPHNHHFNDYSNYAGIYDLDRLQGTNE